MACGLRVHTAEPKVDGVKVGRFPSHMVGGHLCGPVPPRTTHGAPLCALGVGGPLPDIAPHVEQTVHTRAGGSSRSGLGPRVGQVGVGTLGCVTRGPGVGAASNPWCGWGGARFGVGGCPPLGRRGQPPASPDTVGLGLIKGDVHRRELGVDLGLALGLAPGPTRAAYPPMGVFKTTTLAFGPGDHSGGVGKPGELGDGDFRAVYAQRGQADTVPFRCKVGRDPAGEAQANEHVLECHGVDGARQGVTVVAEGLVRCRSHPSVVSVLFGGKTPPPTMFTLWADRLGLQG